MKKIVLSMAAMSGFLVAGGGTFSPIVVASNVEPNNFYAGAGIDALSSRDSSVSMNIFQIEEGQDRLGNFSLHAGYWFTEYLAAEGRYSAGFQDEDGIEMESGWSLFLKPTYKFDDDENRASGENYFAVYGLIGYGEVVLDGVNRVHGEVDHTGFQWGLGVSYTFRAVTDTENYEYRDTWTVFADYTSLGKDMDGHFLDSPRNVDLDAFTLGIVYHF